MRAPLGKDVDLEVLARGHELLGVASDVHHGLQGSAAIGEAVYRAEGFLGGASGLAPEAQRRALRRYEDDVRLSGLTHQLNLAARVPS